MTLDNRTFSLIKRVMVTPNNEICEHSDELKQFESAAKIEGHQDQNRYSRGISVSPQKAAILYRVLLLIRCYCKKVCTLVTYLRFTFLPNVV